MICLRFTLEGTLTHQFFAAQSSFTFSSIYSLHVSKKRWTTFMMDQIDNWRLGLLLSLQESACCALLTCFANCSDCTYPHFRNKSPHTRTTQLNLLAKCFARKSISGHLRIWASALVVFLFQDFCAFTFLRVFSHMFASGMFHLYPHATRITLRTLHRADPSRCGAQCKT